MPGEQILESKHSVTPSPFPLYQYQESLFSGWALILSHKQPKVKHNHTQEFLGFKLPASHSVVIISIFQSKAK
jgi:hypothetical protein